MSSDKNPENNIAAGVPVMKYPNQLDSGKIDFSKGKIRKEKVVMRDGKTGKIFGSKVIHQVTTESTLIQELLRLNEVDEISTPNPHIKDDEALPETVVAELRSNIRKGAKDLEQDWSNALELTHKAYEVSSVGRPSPRDTDQWKQYEALIQFAVAQLAATRGMSGKWRMTSADSL